MDKNLLNLEKNKTERWLPSDSDYKLREKALAQDKMEQLLQELINGSQRRVFLLQMKSKYAGNLLSFEEAEVY